MFASFPRRSRRVTFPLVFFSPSSIPLPSFSNSLSHTVPPIADTPSQLHVVPTNSIYYTPQPQPVPSDALPYMYPTHTTGGAVCVPHATHMHSHLLPHDSHPPSPPQEATEGANHTHQIGTGSSGRQRKRAPRAAKPYQHPVAPVAADPPVRMGPEVPVLPPSSSRFITTSAIGGLVDPNQKTIKTKIINVVVPGSRGKQTCPWGLGCSTQLEIFVPGWTDHLKTHIEDWDQIAATKKATVQCQVAGCNKAYTANKIVLHVLNHHLGRKLLCPKENCKKWLLGCNNNVSSHFKKKHGTALDPSVELVVYMRWGGGAYSEE